MNAHGDQYDRLSNADRELYDRLIGKYGYGHSVRFFVAVDQIQLKSGDKITLPRDGVTAIVAPNNVGKSVLLRDIHMLFQRHNSPAAGLTVAEDMTLHRGGSPADLAEWLLAHAQYVRRADGSGIFALGGMGEGTLESLGVPWLNSRNGLGQLHNLVVDWSGPLERMEFLSFTERRQSIGDAPTHPIHILESNPELTTRFQDLAWRIFRQQLTFDSLGRAIGFRVGETAIPTPPVNAVTPDYQYALSEMPSLSSQGLGMRSLLGLLLPVIAGFFPVILVDEPEAFLHPPQAYQLGRTLATMARERHVQVVLATHDKNVLAGLLADDTAEVSVVRLDRTGNKTAARQLAAHDLRALWSDPILRYTNVLDGLFHRMVVVTEGDADCRFYQAALDEAERQGDLGFPVSDVLFVPANGKSGVAKFVRALRTVGVRTAACVDLDVFENATDVKALIGSFDRNWAAYKGLYDNAVRHLRGPALQPTVGEVLSSINNDLAASRDEPWSIEFQQQVRLATRIEARWGTLKTRGMSAFDDGDRDAAYDLVRDLAAFGLRVVREGTLESFAPNLGVRKGPRWLGAAFEAGAHKSDASVAHARWLVAELADDRH